MPLLSVIMPVYNAEKYLQEAIGSILKQTFTDFEFIIINDGSTDGSEKIILSNPDPRIIYHKNEFNLGLIATLNKAIELARGEFIARMDNDDISAPDRFEVQLNYLNQNEGAQMVCSPIIGISSAGKEMDYWPADIRTKTPGDIRKTLPWENCIAHPTVLIEAKLLKKYLYSLNQRGSEDYDLWLRLARDGVKIVKTGEVLLRYRVHNLSITQKFKATQSPQIKTTLVKLRFFYNSVRELRINFFVFKTLFTIYKDLGFHLKTHIIPSFLNRFKWLVTVDPFKAYKQYAQLKHVLKDHETTAFLFLPYSHVGGAEKVHAQITRVIEEKKTICILHRLK